MSSTNDIALLKIVFGQAEARRLEYWYRKQQNDIRRQLLAHDTTHFGRKRRARRARGRAVGEGRAVFNPDFFPTPPAQAM